MLRRSQTYLLYAVFGVFLSAYVAVTAFPVKAANEKSADSILIIDGSGSMWGRLDGTAKVVIVRGVLPGLIAQLSRKTAMGVMSYGHRQKGVCTDIELILPIEPISRKRHTRAITSISPRGKTPIASAVEDAANVLASRQTRRKRAIFLIADGLENCKRDPCAVARRIAEHDSELAIHVLALAMPSNQAHHLQCLSNTTGGLFRLAQNRDELAQHTADILTAIKQPGHLAALRKTAKQSMPKKKKRKKAPGLYLTAYLKEGGAVLNRPVRWAVFSSQSAAKSRAKPVFRTTKPQPVAKLRPGTYYVTGTYGSVTAAQSVKITANGIGKADIVLNAGIIHPALDERSAPRDLYPLSYTLHRISNGQPEAKPLGRTSNPAHRFIVPAGDYQISVRHRHITAAQRITLSAGETRDVPLHLNASLLRLEARHSPDGAPLQDVLYIITRAAQTEGDRNIEVLRTAAPIPQIALTKGRYTVTAISGNAQTKRDVTLTPGSTEDVTLLMGTGKLRLSVTSGDDTAFSEIVRYRILARAEKPGGKPRLVHQTARPRPEIDLAAGSYVVEATIGEANGKATTKVNVTAGSKQDVVLMAQTGIVNLTATGNNAMGPRHNMFWSVEDDGNRIVFRSSLTRPRLVLAAGRYRVRLSRGTQEYLHTFEVSAGSNQLISVPVN